MRLKKVRNDTVSELRNASETVEVFGREGQMFVTLSIYLRALATAISASEVDLIMWRSHCLKVMPLANNSFRMTV